MAFPNFSMQDDGVNNANNNDLLLQQNGIPYDQSLLQDPNAAGAPSFGPGSNSAFALGGHQSTHSGSQLNSNMLGSFPQQQQYIHQSIMDDNTSLFATLQNQHQLLPQTIQGMMGGSSLQHFANSSSLGGGGINMGGMFTALNSGTNSNFPTMSMVGEPNILNGAQLDNAFLPNSNPSFFLQQQQQQQLQFEQQQQLLLQQQQLQQQLQHNQMQLQQFQRQSMNFPELQPQMQSPPLSNVNSPLLRPLPDLGKLNDANALQYRDDESDKGPKRPTRRLANNTSQSSKTKSFPEKLMSAMLENRDEDAAGWLPDGKSFVIVSPEKFMSQVLGKESKHTTKYASFIRKLHRWGFVRLTSGTGTDCFYHPLFQKNRRDLASKIKSVSNDPAKKGQPPHKMSSSKPPSLAGVDKFVRARAMLKLIAPEATSDPELASIRYDVNGFHASSLENNVETELVEL